MVNESPNNKGFKTQIVSKFQLVIAAAKRSKQITREAKAKGMSPNQVALVDSKHIKPTTLALEEFKASKVSWFQNGEKEKKETSTQEPSHKVEENN